MSRAAQRVLELDVSPLLLDADAPLALHAETHVDYVASSLQRLGAGHASLDASRPWLVFWAVHSLALLGRVDRAHARDICRFLATCAAPSGAGFCGGPGQRPHLAPTYAACAALATLGGQHAAAALNRPALAAFLRRLKQADGSFRMTDGGEVDTRGVYCALATARLAGLLSPELSAGVGHYLCRCQTYEGGLGAEPGAEAHGGYTFCGLAAASLSGQADALDLPRLLHWAVHRQGALEGGFNGRTNKLVDGCYSFWQGGLFPLLQAHMPQLLAQLRPCRAVQRNGGADGDGDGDGPPPFIPDAAVLRRAHAARLFPPPPLGGTGEAVLYNAAALQGWLLACCQTRGGGLRDKPGKGRDLYHTCYCLSGLSSAQHYGGAGVLGGPANGVERADPLVNVAASRLEAWDAFLSAAVLGGQAHT